VLSVIGRKQSNQKKAEQNAAGKSDKRAPEHNGSPPEVVFVEPERKDDKPYN